MVEAEGLSVGVAWAGLLGGDVHVTGVELIQPVIRLSQSADGSVNWDLATGGTSTEPSSGGGGSIALDEATVTDGTLIYSVEGAEPVTLSAIDATLTLPDFAGEATLALTALANGEPVGANLTIAAFEAFLGAGSGLALNAEIGGGTLGFDGEAGLQPLSAAGRIAADLKGLGALTRAAGVEAAMPPGLGQDRIALDTGLAFDGDTLGLSGMTLGLDGNSFAGDLDLALGGSRPRLSGTVNAGALDLSGLSGDEPEAAAEPGPVRRLVHRPHRRLGSRRHRCRSRLLRREHCARRLPVRPHRSPDFSRRSPSRHHDPRTDRL